MNTLKLPKQLAVFIMMMNFFLLLLLSASCLSLSLFSLLFGVHCWSLVIVTISWLCSLARPHTIRASFHFVVYTLRLWFVWFSCDCMSVYSEALFEAKYTHYSQTHTCNDSADSHTINTRRESRFFWSFLVVLSRFLLLPLITHWCCLLLNAVFFHSSFGALAHSLTSFGWISFVIVVVVFHILFSHRRRSALPEILREWKIYIHTKNSISY